MFFQGVEAKGFQVILSLLLSLPFLFLFLHSCVFCFIVLGQSSFMHCFVLCNMFLFGYFSVLLYFVFHIKINKKIEKSEKYKNNVCLCTLVLVYLEWPLKQNFLNVVSFVA